ncbi:putative lipid II flippase FtsW [Thiomicrospira microaerophila]|uniref:putative lipid II flippase FtsW n=1 Tax=Thiomicrospira microaerophila TaxID=406020 RepID=UPI00200FF298|nr:putative lipid II flippase FtsW [Thiomicrospira microaerophila]UQB42638.1 putative lipid II flippase FtsW [Thiomicrospira microaerophila]
MKALFDSPQQREWPVDYWLVGSLMLLVFLGLAMVLSSSVAISEQRFGIATHYFVRQAIALGIGLFLAMLVFKVPIDFWQTHRGKLFIFGLILLVMVLVFGREIGGSKRWLPLVIMNFQPAEFVKIAAIIFVAGYLHRHLSAVKEDFNAIMRLSLPFGLMALLLLLQPDYGTTLLIAAVVTGMLIISGAPWRYFLLTVVPVIGLLGALVVYSPYRLARVLSFMDPWQDPFGTGYQLIQALIASGSGGFFGQGLGASVQKLLYLPDAHTDFLFSIFAEEFGFIGVFGLILLFSFVVWRLFVIAAFAKQRGYAFAGLMVFGIAMWIALQAMINMGVNLGLFPTKGLTLPFMSYGGSSLMMLCVAMALVLRVDYEARLEPYQEKNHVDEEPETAQA